jgi:hypothetical protein
VSRTLADRTVTTAMSTLPFASLKTTAALSRRTTLPALTGLDPIR